MLENSIPLMAMKTFGQGGIFHCPNVGPPGGRNPRSSPGHEAKEEHTMSTTQKITAFFTRRPATSDFAQLPAPIRNEVLSAMEATSVYDIR